MVLKKTLSDCIKGEEWKIDMITEILDCIKDKKGTCYSTCFMFI